MNIKKYNDFVNESHEDFDSKIKLELEKLLKNTKYGIDGRVDQLLKIHNNWINLVRKDHTPSEIAEVLYKYDKNIRKYN